MKSFSSVAMGILVKRLGENAMPHFTYTFHFRNSGSNPDSNVYRFTDNDKTKEDAV